MDWSDTASAVVPSLDSAVFSVLAATTRPLTGREVGRLARRGSPAGIQNILNRLEEHGLVTATIAGPARLYLLNRDHIAAPAVLALQDLRGQLFARVRQALTDWDPAPLAAAAFGSAARGDGHTDSDVDILVVRPEEAGDGDGWDNQVDALAQAVRRWSGNPASIIQLTVPELADMVARGEPIADALRTEKVDLTATDVFALVVGAR